MSSLDKSLSLEGLLEALVAERLARCQGLPEGTTVHTETSGDDAGEEDLPEEERGTPSVYVAAVREEEQMTRSGIYSLSVTVRLRAHETQLSKSRFSAVLNDLSDSIDCMKSEESGTSQVHVYNVILTTSSPMEYEEGVRSKELSFTVIATANMQRAVPRYVTEDRTAVYVPEHA